MVFRGVTMLVVRAPFRITLGGGGTDLPNWYKQHGGFLISAAINKYIYLTGCERPFDKKIWLSYSKVEIKENVEEVEHEILKAVLQKYDLANGIEIHSISDLPGKSGLGSSGSFSTAACYLLNQLTRFQAPLKEVAEMACHVEMVDLGRSSGKQDQYISTFGGISTLQIDTNGSVDINPLKLDAITSKMLCQNLLIYHSGISRSTIKLLKDQNDSLCKPGDNTKYMKKIQDIGFQSEKALKMGDLNEFGKLLHEHWCIKQKFGKGMSSNFLNEIYDFGLDSGALGGKIMGAGGGGYFMFYVPEGLQGKFRRKMATQNFVELDWQFDHTGVTKVFGD